jgi:hypothetical protein
MDTVARVFASGPLWWLGWFLVYLALALTVIRGLPVVFDSWAYIGGATRART